MAVQKYDDLFNPVLRALYDLGGSASVSEMEDKVSEIIKLSDEDANDIHKGNITKLSYRLAWARTYLKRFGLLENSSRSIWSLTAKGKTVKTVDKNEVKKFIQSLDKGDSIQENGRSIIVHPDKDHLRLESLDLPTWQDKILTIIKSLSPAEFERLTQRVLREAGFIKVEVTGRSGDEGIDGKGILKVGSIIGFRVIFQCKRYKNTVSSQEIREFKGTMVGRADKGLFITTGTFTHEAKKEASRDGSPPIDLIDGEQLVTIMKDLGLGVNKAEVIEVDQEWFKSF